jgi:hypothetical protein
MTFNLSHFDDTTLFYRCKKCKLYRQKENMYNDKVCNLCSLTKNCTKCKEDKELYDFYDQKKALDQKDSQCKMCRKEAKRVKYSLATFPKMAKI